MSNETKQTAIDIFKEKLIDIFEDYHDGIITLDEYIENINKATQQAKEIEREQMIDFASLFANSDSVYIEYDCEDCPAELTIESPDRLFELTYGGNK